MIWVIPPSNDDDENLNDMFHNLSTAPIEPNAEKAHMDERDVFPFLTELQAKVNVLHRFYDKQMEKPEDFQHNIDLETIGNIFGWGKKEVTDEN